MNQIMQHSISCMANSVDPDQPASSTLFTRKPAYRFRKLKMLNWFFLSFNAVYVICNVTRKIVLTFSNIFSEKAS